MQEGGASHFTKRENKEKQDKMLRGTRPMYLHTTVGKNSRHHKAMYVR